MDLVRLGGFPVLGRYLFWDREYGMAVDVLEVDDSDVYWVRCVAGFRLLGQGESGRELWTRNLSKMSRYLKDSFSDFRLSVDFADTVDESVVGIQDEAEQLGVQTDELINRKEEIESSLESLERSMSLSAGGDLDDMVERRFTRLEEELDKVDTDLDRVLDRLDFLSAVRDEWEKKGYSVSVCFSVSSGFERVATGEFRKVVDQQLQELKHRCDRSIKQKLQGEKFRLQFTELDTPHQLLQHFYTPLVHPGGSLDEEVFSEMLEMYIAFAAEDIEVDGLVRHEEKAGAARSVNAILQHLESSGSANFSSIESTGPLLGSVSGTQMKFGIDPADQPHFYIVGSTGSGKSYTKRVLLENCLALDYNIVSVTPRDLEALSAYRPYDGDGTGIVGNYYWLGDNMLLDEPSDFSEFFNGASFVSLQGAVFR